MVISSIAYNFWEWLWGSMCAVSMDLVLDEKLDILDDGLFSLLRRLAWCGFLVSGLFGLPCSTISRSRRRPGGSPPLRSRPFLYGLSYEPERP